MRHAVPHDSEARVIDERGVGRPDRPAGQTLPVAARTPPKEAAAGNEGGREALLLAAASAGLPLAPAAHPAPGYRCSCDRVGCPTPARHPVSFAWQTQSTTDRSQIERWARHQPQANFITATGMVHDVLDVPLEAGLEALERLLGSGIEVGPVAESDDGRLPVLHPHPRHPRGRGRVVAVRTGLPPRDGRRTPRPALALPGFLRPRTARPAPRRPGRALGPRPRTPAARPAEPPGSPHRRLLPLRRRGAGPRERGLAPAPVAGGPVSTNPSRTSVPGSDRAR